mmetsp:Transcript_38291/g.34142  ORF Transcript_38291/g.34142 Transcript_38291/m.34142 type:complete len:92 (+) Transcript_38291:672-947(+)
MQPKNSFSPFSPRKSDKKSPKSFLNISDNGLSDSIFDFENEKFLSSQEKNEILTRNTTPSKLKRKNPNADVRFWELRIPDIREYGSDFRFA